MIFTPSPVTNSHAFQDPSPGASQTLWTTPITDLYLDSLSLNLYAY